MSRGDLYLEWVSVPPTFPGAAYDSWKTDSGREGYEESSSTAEGRRGPEAKGWCVQCGAGLRKEAEARRVPMRCNGCAETPSPAAAFCWRDGVRLHDHACPRCDRFGVCRRCRAHHDHIATWGDYYGGLCLECQILESDQPDQDLEF